MLKKINFIKKRFLMIGIVLWGAFCLPSHGMDQGKIPGGDFFEALFSMSEGRTSPSNTSADGGEGGQIPSMNDFQDFGLFSKRSENRDQGNPPIFQGKYGLNPDDMGFIQQMMGFQENLNRGLFAAFNPEREDAPTSLSELFDTVESVANEARAGKIFSGPSESNAQWGEGVYEVFEDEEFTQDNTVRDESPTLLDPLKEFFRRPPTPTNLDTPAQKLKVALEEKIALTEAGSKAIEWLDLASGWIGQKAQESYGWKEAYAHDQEGFDMGEYAKWTLFEALDLVGTTYNYGKAYTRRGMRAVGVPSATAQDIVGTVDLALQVTGATGLVKGAGKTVAAATRKAKKSMAAASKKSLAGEAAAAEISDFKPQYPLGELSAKPSDVPQNRATHERYLAEKRANLTRADVMGVRDDKLRVIVDQLYRPTASFESGSTAAAYRLEKRTSQPVGGKFHNQKLYDNKNALTKWVQNNPEGHLDDLRIAQDILFDIRQALGEI